MFTLVDEVWRSIVKLKKPKPGGMDWILGKIWKYDEEVLVSSLHTLIVVFWECEKSPKE